MGRSNPAWGFLAKQSRKPAAVARFSHSDCHRAKRTTLAFEPLESRALLSADPGWALGLGGAAFAADSQVAVGPDGSYYASGSFSGTVDFDPGPGVTQLTARVDATDNFIAKYTPQGQLVWAQKLGGLRNEFSESLEFDGLGNLYIVGTTISNPAQFGAANLTTQGEFDVYIAKINAASGSFVWARTFGGASTESATHATVSPTGEVYITGSFYGLADFDPSPTSVFTMAPATGPGIADAFVTKLDAAGNFVWARQFSSQYNEHGHRTALGADGDLYAVGTFRGTTDFGEPGDPLLLTAPKTDLADIFIVKMDAATGESLWARHATGPEHINAARVAADGAGGIYVAGGFEGQVNFGPGTPTLTSAGQADVFLAKWDADGNLTWAESLATGSGNAIPRAFGVDGAGNPLLSVEFTGSADFDPGASETNFTSVDSGNDTAILKLLADGSFAWARHVAGPGETFVGDLSEDAVGNVIVGGMFQNSVTLPTGHQFSRPGNGNFLMKLAFGDPPPPADVMYFSLLNNATIGGVAAANEDILARDENGAFRMVFDGSDVGLSNLTLEAFDVIATNQILLSFTSSVNLSGAGSVAVGDIVLFTASSLGENTAGTFSMYFDGSDVGLTTNNEAIDALQRLDDGRLVVSTRGSVSVSGASGAGEDLLVFTPSSLGSSTSGSWGVYFDGSDVGLSGSAENIDAVAVDGSGRVYLSTTGNFSVTGASGANEDIVRFQPTRLGSTTAGSFGTGLFFDGSAFGLSANDLTGIDIPELPGGGPLLAKTSAQLAPVLAPRTTVEAPAAASASALAVDAVFSSLAPASEDLLIDLDTKEPRTKGPVSQGPNQSPFGPATAADEALEDGIAIVLARFFQR